MNDRNIQFVVSDTEGTRLYEIHKDSRSLGGFDYVNQSYLSKVECRRLLRDLTQSKEDDSKIAAYTLAEIMHLLKLNPFLETLRKIHEAKRVFGNSKIRGDNYA